MCVAHITNNTLSFVILWREKFFWKKFNTIFVLYFVKYFGRNFFFFNFYEK